MKGYIKTNTKLDKKQIDAINGVICDMDELSNKPRRLYSALKDMAKAFIDEGKGLDETIRDLDEAETLFYKSKYKDDRDMANGLVELKRWMNDLSFEGERSIRTNEYINEAHKDDAIRYYKQGVEAMYQIAVSKLIRVFYPHTDVTTNYNYDLDREIRTVLQSYEEDAVERRARDVSAREAKLVGKNKAK